MANIKPKTTRDRIANAIEKSRPVARQGLNPHQEAIVYQTSKRGTLGAGTPRKKTTK
jgi:hypothetical protein